MSILYGVLVQLLLGLLATVQARADFRARVEAELAQPGQERARAALEFLRAAAARPDGGAGLSDRGGTIDLSRHDADP